MTIESNNQKAFATEERDQFFNLSPDLLCIADLDGHLRQINPAWERTFGYGREELMSRSLIDLVHPEDQPRTREQLQRLAEGQEVIDYRSRHRCRDGSWKWLEWRSIPGPSQTLIYAIGRDITEQMQTREALDDARMLVQRAAEVMPSFLYVYDFVDTRSVFVNREVSASLGLPEGYFERLGMEGMSSVMHPEDLPRFRLHLENIKQLNDGEVRELTYRMHHADGSWHWFHDRDAVFDRAVDGSVRRYIGTATDVTAIKQTESALNDNAQRLEVALAAASMGVWEHDLRTGANAWSEAFARVMRLSVDDAPQGPEEFLELVHPADREPQQRRLVEAVANRSVYTTEFRQNLPEGQVRWIAAQGKVICDDAGAPARLLGVGWDVTARKQADEERAQLEAALRHSQKMEALGALAGGIAHDFNNILTAIRGNARLALQDLPSEHSAHVSVEEILRGSQRAADLVHRILAFSRKDEPSLQPIDVNAVVEEAVNLLKASVPARVSIKFQPCDSRPVVLADATQIHQIVMNLGTNSRDALGKRGGVLAIRLCEKCPDARQQPLAKDMSGKRCLCLSVEDNGPGMSSQTLERIFEPFFTTKLAGRGTGMGLAMVHGIVRRHGGIIIASSEPGCGARFDLYFPLAHDSATHEQERAAAQSASGQGERILYVDDEEPLVFLATRMLTRMGYVVTGHIDAQQALNEFRANPLDYDMVITDVGMPGMSGLDLTAEILSIRPDVPVIITSGYIRAEDTEYAHAIGAAAVVLKPDTVQEMARLIDEQVGAKRKPRREVT